MSNEKARYELWKNKPGGGNAKDCKGSAMIGKRHKAITLLLDGHSKSETAAILGVNPATMSRWLADPEFKQALRDGADQALNEATRRLSAAMSQAVDLLIDVMEGRIAGTGTPSRLRAAEAVLSHAVKIHEYSDLIERVAALESQIMRC